ncbi:MAG: hypothetical protein AAFP69_19680, partial [Planctomycetota bacterium]
NGVADHDGVRAVFDLFVRKRHFTGSVGFAVAFLMAFFAEQIDYLRNRRIDDACGVLRNDNRGSATLWL